jgi:hypothetical protein
VSAPAAVKQWIAPDRYKIFAIREPSFNPARLAHRLVQSALTQNNCSVRRAAVVRIDRAGDVFRITLSTGEVIEVDAIVNAMGGWLNNFESTLPLWRPRLMWSQWRLLALDTELVGAERLEHVLTIDRAPTGAHPNRGPLAAVPHGRWVIFGCDMPARRMQSQDEMPPGDGWRVYDPADLMDRFLMDEHADHFLLLPESLKSRIAPALYSFPGVYPEILPSNVAGLEDGAVRIPTPYLDKAVWENGGVRGYYPLFGGSATTSFLDARDAFAYLLGQHGLSTADRDEWIRRIAVNLPHPPTAGGMIWERHEPTLPNVTLPIAA